MLIIEVSTSIDEPISGYIAVTLFLVLPWCAGAKYCPGNSPFIKAVLANRRIVCHVSAIIINTINTYDYGGLTMRRDSHIIMAQMHAPKFPGCHYFAALLI